MMDDMTTLFLSQWVGIKELQDVPLTLLPQDIVYTFQNCHPCVFKSILIL